MKSAKKRGPRSDRSPVTRNEAALLVNPLDANHVVGVEEVRSPAGKPAVSARVTFDGGGCWRESWPLPAEAHWGGLVGPVLAIDARGNLNLAALALEPHSSSATLVVYRSEDGGIHWGSPVAVLKGSAECSYSISADLYPDSRFRGSVYLVADLENRLCFARSVDGKDWKHQRNTLPAGFCLNPEVIVDARGTAHVVWMTGPAGCNILSAASEDGGTTFGEVIPIAVGITGVQGGLPETVPATCIAADGVALCVWADNREGRSRIYARRSLDGGRTWQGPSSGQPLMPNGASGQQEFQPHLIVAGGGEICCAFYEYGPKTEGGGSMVSLALAVSYDRGATFPGRMILSDNPWDPSVDPPLSRAATRGALGWLTL